MLFGTRQIRPGASRGVWSMQFCLTTDVIVDNISIVGRKGKPSWPIPIFSKPLSLWNSVVVVESIVFRVSMLFYTVDSTKPMENRLSVCAITLWYY